MITVVSTSTDFRCYVERIFLPSSCSKHTIDTICVHLQRMFSHSCFSLVACSVRPPQSDARSALPPWNASLDVTTFMLSTSTKVLQSLNYTGVYNHWTTPESSPYYRYSTHILSVSKPLLSPVYLYAIGQTNTKNNFRLIPKFHSVDVSIFRLLSRH